MSTESRTIAQVATLAPGSRLGPYEILAPLGAGGMGVVYEADDRTRGRRVALKVLPAHDPDALHRFKKEFRIAADLEHDNLVRLHDLIAIDGAWAYSMDLVRGDSIRVALMAPGVVPGSPLYFERLRSFFAQLARGVAALHAARLLHRDIKPANVLVERGTDRVVLLDFGLVEARGADAPNRRARVAGTPEYLAPETARGDAPVPASDWYAFGVLLFETLTGMLPIRGGGTREILLKKTESDPPRPSDLRPGLPLDLDLLTVRLLSRDPRARPTFEEIEATLAHGARPAPVSVPPRMLAGPTQRLRELSQLGECLAQVQRGAPVSALVEGAAGAGKSALVAAFADWVGAQPDAVVLSARCHPREALPFKGLDPIVDALTEYLLAMPAELASSIVPSDIRFAVELFPVLSRAKSVRRASLTPTPVPIDDGDERMKVPRAFAALKVLVRRLARVRRLVVILEDLEWGDTDSGRLIAELLSPPEAPAFLFVGTCSAASEGAPFRQALSQAPLGTRRRLISL